MSTKRINVTTILPPSALFIGYVAENGVTNVEFDVSAWVTMYGSGTATLIMKRWGDANPYPIALEVDNEGLATWTISATDTAKKGFAYVQLRYEAGTKVKKSPIYTLKIGESLGSPAEAPDQYEDWIDALTHLAAQAMAEVLDIEGIVTDKTLTVDGGIADAKATGDALALKADKSTTYTKTEVDALIDEVEVETDTTLEIAGAPADAKKTGDELSALKADLDDNVNDLKSAIDTTNNELLADKSLTSQYHAGRYITLNVGIGNIVDVGTTVSASGYAYIIQPCKIGEKFTLYGRGASAPRLWGFTDEQYKLLDVAESNITITQGNPLTLTAVKNGYFISNVNTASDYGLIYYAFYDYADVGYVDDVNLEAVNGYIQVGKNKYRRGIFRDGYGVIQDNKDYVAGPFAVKTGDVLYINHGLLYVYTLIANSENTIIATINGTYQSFSQPSDYVYTVNNDGLFYICTRNAKANADASVFDKNNIDVELQIRNTLSYKLKETVDTLSETVDTLSGTVTPLLSFVHGFSMTGLLLRYGHYSSTGNYNYSLKTVSTTNYIKMKAGDTISCDEGYEFQVGGYSVSNSASSWTIYRTFSADAFTVESDSWIKIGIRKTDQSNLNNLSIANHLHISTVTTTEQCRFDLRRFTNFSGIPNGTYIGKHIDVTGYRQSTDYSTIISAWDALVDNKYITKEDLGETYDGNHIYCYTLSPNTQTGGASTNITLNGKNKPTVIVVTGMHGHEKSGTYGLLYMMNDLLNHATEDPILAYLRSNVTFKIIPACNVYGWINNSRYNANGVNLNRNFGTISWETYNPEDSTEPFTYNYKGTAPFSELETQYIRDVIAHAPTTSLIVDWHTNGLDTTSYADFADFATAYSTMTDYDKRLADVAVEMRNLLNPLIKDLYEIPGDANQIFGNAYIEPDRPELTNWGFDGTNTISTLLETSPGSTTGFLGTKLSKYSPDVIKMNAEIFVNYIIRILSVLGY